MKASSFHQILPADRLGVVHNSLEDFQTTINFHAEKKKEYSLVVVTEEPRRILLGKKHRGFGKGMYNSFGGKLEPNKTDVESASRELEEETGISIPVAMMKKRKIGIQRFTFIDSPLEMIVHVFRVKINTKDETHELYVDPKCIRGCEEITPEWFEDWQDIPLHNMHADDSVWLTQALTSPIDLYFDGWFHFHPGGTDVNAIAHRYVESRPKDPTSAPLHPLNLN